MGSNKYQLRRQWSEEESCRWRGLNKTHFCRGSVLQWGVGGWGTVAAVTSAERSQPVAADAGRQVEWGRRQTMLCPREDGSSTLIRCMIHHGPTWPRTGKEVPYKKLFLFWSHFFKVSPWFVPKWLAGLWGCFFQREGLFECGKEGNKVSLIRFCQHYSPQYQHQ